MNGVFIVPTGIGAEIGGHSGDATPAAKMIASLCDKLIVHPNVVNASDINEMTENMLYVEGSILDGFLSRQYGLIEVKRNKILLAVNEVLPEIINAVSAARVTIGADISILKLDTPIVMKTRFQEGAATGHITGCDELLEQIVGGDFDVLVVNTPITTPAEDVLCYLNETGGVNLWGGVEAKLSKKLSAALGRPVIHAPVESSEVFKTFNKPVDPRKSAEMVSVCYLHCCLKGASVAPRISDAHNAMWREEIDFLVTPAQVFGKPHRSCNRVGIPIIAVEENKTILRDAMPENVIVVKNYLEAAGVISAMKAGVTLESVRRPIKMTKVNNVSQIILKEAKK